MRFDPPFLAASQTRGPLSRLDDRIKLIGLILYVLTVAGTPIARWNVFAIEAFLLLAAWIASRASVRKVLIVWAAGLPVVIFLAASVALSSRLGFRPRDVFMTILFKNALALGATVVFATITPWPRLLSALDRLHVPKAFTATLMFMERFLSIFLDELNRMTIARRARSFRKGGGLSASVAASLTGVLFTRSLERGERVHAALLARGWDGRRRSLEE